MKSLKKLAKEHSLLFIFTLLPLYIALFFALKPFSIFIVGLFTQTASPFGVALEFFLVDTPKIFLLLMGIVFFMGLIQSRLSGEAIKNYLSGKKKSTAHIMAAFLGVLTPFCSCSAVPLFIGFVRAGIPLGVTFSFLIASPMVNEVALTLLWALFGFKVAALYLGFGVGIAIIAGMLIGHLKVEKYIKEWVKDPAEEDPQSLQQKKRSLGGSLVFALSSVSFTVRQVWLYIIIGIAIGATIHGFVPDAFMASFMGKKDWWAVPLAVIMGIPLYSSATGMIPILQALLAKGAALGTLLAFMMSVVALSLPEILILKKVLKTPLLLTFVGIVGFCILLVGLAFNWIL